MTLKLYPYIYTIYIIFLGIGPVFLGVYYLHFMFIFFRKTIKKMLRVKKKNKNMFVCFVNKTVV